MSARRWAIGTQVVAALAVAGCGADEVEPAPPPLSGELCNSRLSQCLSDDEALVCVDRVWTTEPCREYCAAKGYVSVGCDRRLGACECAQPASPDAGASGDCSPGTTHCWQGETLLVCGDQHEWEERPCAELCGVMAPPRLSAGCSHGYRDACRCTLEGTPCTEQPARCDGGDRLLRCTAGSWTVEYCGGFCETGGWTACSAFATEEGAGCVCASA